METKTSSFPILGIMFLIFMTLKLVGTIDWSWWWVTAPLWGPFAIIGGILLLAVMVSSLAAGLGYLVGKCKKQNTKRVGRN